MACAERTGSRCPGGDRVGARLTSRRSASRARNAAKVGATGRLASGARPRALMGQQGSASPASGARPRARAAQQTSAQRGPDQALGCARERRGDDQHNGDQHRALGRASERRCQRTSPIIKPTHVCARHCMWPAIFMGPVEGAAAPVEVIERSSCLELLVDKLPHCVERCSGRPNAEHSASLASVAIMQSILKIGVRYASGYLAFRYRRCGQAAPGRRPAPLRCGSGPRSLRNTLRTWTLTVALA